MVQNGRHNRAMSDLHSALKTEIIGRQSGTTAEFVLVHLQDSKTADRWTLHARPGSFTTAWWQTTDVLGTLGFRHSRCNFVLGEQCYARTISRDFSLEQFVPQFENAARELLASRRSDLVTLQECRRPADAAVAPEQSGLRSLDGGGRQAVRGCPGGHGRALGREARRPGTLPQWFC